MEIRNGEMGVKYVKDGEVGSIPVVRRKTSARSEVSESSGNLNVNDKEAWCGTRRWILTASKVFVSPSLFNILRFLAVMPPLMISFLIEVG